MQNTIEPTLETVAHARCQFESISERLLHLLSFVPDDKLNWTPSATAKSSLRIVAHCAMTSRSIANIITGTMPESMPSPEAFFSGLHAVEVKITQRECAIAAVNETTAELCKALNSVNTENIHTTPDSPFGPVAMQFWVELGYRHMAGHVGQLEYLQTIWGDLDNHLS